MAASPGSLPDAPPAPLRGVPRGRLSPDLLRVASLVTGVVSILAYQAVGRQFYGGYHVPQGYGMTHLLPEELAHIALFTAFGLAAIGSFSLALRQTSLARLAEQGFRRLAAAGWTVAVVSALLIFGGAFWIARFQLGHAVTTDDEHVYRFIAQTLRWGRLVAPSPGSDFEFFREQFVILGPHGRYGQYPIGYPLVLAIGQALGVEQLVVPALTSLLALPVYLIASTLYGRTTAALAVVLLAVSPQVLLTGATLLSQPASALCMLTGLAALLAAEKADKGRIPLLAGAGAAFGCGVLVRPLPSALFALAAALHVARPVLSHVYRRAALAGSLVFGGALLVPVAILLGVNRTQAGGMLSSGYQTLYRTGEGAAGLLSLLGGGLASEAMSLVSALLRLQVWLLGWPLAAVACLLARAHPRRALLWAMVGAALAYRLLSPKAGVGATGPVYLFEVVPICCVLAASGFARLASGQISLGQLRPAAGTVAALLMSGLLAEVTMFLPVKFADLRGMGRAQLLLPALLRERGISRALVFHRGIVPPWTGLSWAYFPPDNSPGLDDDVLYLRLPADAEGGGRARELWKRRYPDRSAWYFGYLDGQPRLLELDEYLHRQATPVDPPR